MPEEVEVETKELQETIEELHEERREREEEQKRNAWTRWIALTTALLAVFAAIGALQSGKLINEAMLSQLKASDKWNEYQATRLKDHLYTLEANALLDLGAAPAAADHTAAPNEEASKQAPHQVAAVPHEKNPGHGEKPAKKEGGEKKGPSWKPLKPEARLASYIEKQGKEYDKESKLQEDAEKLEKESEHHMEQHEKFAHSVALIQVAIALSAVAALTRMKSVWAISLAAGAGGIVMFLGGLAAH